MLIRVHADSLEYASTSITYRVPTCWDMSYIASRHLEKKRR